MRNFLIIASLSIFTLAGCGAQNDVDVPRNRETEVSKTPSSPSSPLPDAPVNIPLNLKGLNSVGQPGVAGLNPEHGKPGHRCDIAVGAPLNSNPSSAASPTIKTAAPAAPTVKPGMNPQHGQPGHRCDIAVGAPLNSKPLPAATPAQ